MKVVVAVEHPIAGALRHELARTQPERMAELHGRASAWFGEQGAVAEAIGHAIAAGEVPRASELIAGHWYGFLQRGRIETVAAWLEATLGARAVDAVYESRVGDEVLHARIEDGGSVRRAG